MSGQSLVLRHNITGARKWTIWIPWQSQKLKNVSRETLSLWYSCIHIEFKLPMLNYVFHLFIYNTQWIIREIAKWLVW